MRQYQQHARILEVTTDNVRVPLPGYDTEHYTVDELVELIKKWDAENTAAYKAALESGDGDVHYNECVVEVCTALTYLPDSGDPVYSYSYIYADGTIE